MRWELVRIIAVSGLVNVGFVPNSNLIIVVSHNGRGIFDCSTGEKIARSYDEIWGFFDDQTGEVKGFDLLADQTIQTHGLFGRDNLSKTTKDGWRLEKLEKDNFDQIILVSPVQDKLIVGDDEVVEIKAFGFAENEQFFVIAMGSDLTIYQRAK
jgi:hypothetical protein